MGVSNGLGLWVLLIVQRSTCADRHLRERRSDLGLLVETHVLPNLAASDRAERGSRSIQAKRGAVVRHVFNGEPVELDANMHARIHF